MKGLILSLTNARKEENVTVVRKVDYKFFLKRYSVTIIFSLFIVPGLVFGAIFSNVANLEFIEMLDIVFLTDYAKRLNQTLLLTFATSICSYFILFLIQVLLAFCAWGFIFLPFTAFIKGFGIGLCVGQLTILHNFTGLGYFFLIMLPATILSVICVILQGKNSFYLSKKILKSLIKEKNDGLKVKTQFVSKYLISSANMLILMAVSSVIDVLTTLCFSSFFSF